MQGDGIPLGDQGDQDKDDEARGEGGCDQDHCEAGGDEAARDQEVRGALGGRVGGGYIEHAHKEGMPNGGEGDPCGGGGGGGVEGDDQGGGGVQGQGGTQVRAMSLMSKARIGVMVMTMMRVRQGVMAMTMVGVRQGVTR